MKRIKVFLAVLALILIYLVYLAYNFFKMPTKDLKIYSDIYTITKAYPMLNETDTFFNIDDSLIINQQRRSDGFSFVYEMNTGEYDSVYYFGVYPSLEMIERDYPDLYQSYKKYYSSLICNLNFYSLDDDHFYDAFALYKNGSVSFCKIKGTSNKVSISPYYTMFRNKQKFKVIGSNYEYRKERFTIVDFEPVDSVYITEKDYVIDSVATQ